MTKKQSEIPPMVIGPRLKRCLEAGGAVGLFPVLKDWTQDELLELEGEIATWLESADATLDSIFTRHAFTIETFLSPAAPKDLDHSIQRKRVEITNTAAEIFSVLYCYLECPRVNKEGPTEAELAVWPNCSVADCENKACRSESSDKCHPHTHTPKARMRCQS